MAPRRPLARRRFAAGAPVRRRRPGMWFSIELPQPVLLTEVQFDSMAAVGGGRGGRGGADCPRPALRHCPRGAPALATAPAGQHGGARWCASCRERPPAPQGRGRGGFGGGTPVVGYPRGYSVQVSTTGRTGASQWPKAKETARTQRSPFAPIARSSFASRRPKRRPSRRRGRSETCASTKRRRRHRSEARHRGRPGRVPLSRKHPVARGYP